jgi:AcrR family transcriptional regulator
MGQTEPKFRRRKAERPAEIVRAALATFGEKGFAAARIDEIARRAGVSKGAVYLYFPTKEELFRAVVEQAIAPHLMAIRQALLSHPGPFRDLLAELLERLAEVVIRLPVGGVARMVIGEARNFPELARVWHDELVSVALEALAGAVERAQARGEIRSGDARAIALQLVAPLFMAVLWRETFVPAGAAPFDIPALARQHAATLLHGLLAKPETP